jgi:predicted ester cyclase
MTEVIVYDDSAWPRTMRGHADVREFLGFVWRAVPNLEFRMVDGTFVLQVAPRASFSWTGAGTFSGPLDPPGCARTGASIEFDGFDIHDYRAGRVCRLRIVFDMMNVSRQIGIVPKPVTRAEKAGAAVQRLGVSLRARLRR